MKLQVPGWLEELWSDLLTPPKFLSSSHAGTSKTTTHSNSKESQKNTGSGVKGGSGKGNSANKPTVQSSTTSSGHRSTRPTSVPVTSSKKASATKSDVKTRDTGASTPAYSLSDDDSQTNKTEKNERSPQSLLNAYPFTVTEQDIISGITRLRTSDGLLALKQTKLTAERLQFIDRALRHCSNRGFTAFSRIVRTSAGSPFSVDEDGQHYVVTEWVHGRRVNFGSLGDIGQSAHTLAQLHEVTRGYQPRGYIPPNAFGLYDQLKERSQQLAEYAKRARQGSSHRDIDAIVVEQAVAADRQATEALSLLRSASAKGHLEREAKQPGLCHLDVTANHIMIRPDGRAALLHFDQLSHAPRMLDLAHLVRRGMQAQGWRPEVALVALVQYNTIRGLTEGEYSVLEGLLSFPHRLWHLTHTYYGLRKSVQLKVFEEYVRQQSSRTRFLQAFARQVNHRRLGESRS